MSENPSKDYLTNAQGHLVPLETIKQIDLIRNDLVIDIVERTKRLSAMIKAFKSEVFGDIAAFVQLSAEEYGVSIGGDKGNIMLTSFDGKYKVVRQVAEYLTFDERLQAAKALVDDCIRRWSQNARPEIQVLVNDAFRVDTQGNINTNRVLGLRRLSITDEMWQRAMKAISDAVQVSGTKSYIRIYERIATSGGLSEWKPIPLDAAGA